MKLNNKGFAISIIIYSVGSLAVLTLILILAIDSGIRKNNTAIVDAIKDELNAASKSRWTFTYSATPEAFTVPETGTYQLEVWGASGGSLGGAAGNGGYATAKLTLTYNSTIYVVVGSAGNSYNGGYNGGGNGGIATGSEGTQSGAGICAFRQLRGNVVLLIFTFRHETVFAKTGVNNYHFFVKIQSFSGIE